MTISLDTARKIFFFIERNHSSSNANDYQKQDGKLSFDELKNFEIDRFSHYSEFHKYGLKMDDVKDFISLFAKLSGTIDEKEFQRIAKLHDSDFLDIYDLMYEIEHKGFESGEILTHAFKKSDRPIGATEEQAINFLKYVDENFGDKNKDEVVRAGEFRLFEESYKKGSIPSDVIRNLGGDECIRNLIVYFLNSDYDHVSHSKSSYEGLTYSIEDIKNIKNWRKEAPAKSSSSITTETMKARRTNQQNLDKVKLDYRDFSTILAFIESKVGDGGVDKPMWVKDSQTKETSWGSRDVQKKDFKIDFYELKTFLELYNSGLFDTAQFAEDLKEITGAINNDKLNKFLSMLCTVSSDAESVMYKIDSEKFDKFAFLYCERVQMNVVENESLSFLDFNTYLNIQMKENINATSNSQSSNLNVSA